MNTPKNKPILRAVAACVAGKCTIPFALATVLHVYISYASATSIPGFQGLGDLPGGDVWSKVHDVSADGSVVVGWSRTAMGPEAFAWTPGGGMVGLGDLPGGVFLSDAVGVSANGTVIVGDSNSDMGFEAFRWTADQGMVGLGDLPGGGFGSGALDASDDGLVVVGVGLVVGNELDPETGLPIPAQEAFRWTADGGMVGLGDLPGGGLFSKAWGVSADGSIVVGESTSTSGKEAFRWTAEQGMVGLGDLPGGKFFSQAVAISDDGTTIVGLSESAGGTSTFRWTQATGVVKIEGLGTVRAVSADGSMILGGAATGATIWDQEHGTRLLHDILVNDLGLDLTGWVLQDAWGVSADGLTVVGDGINPDGNQEAFIATIPEPASLAALLALGPVLLAAERRAAVRDRPLNGEKS